jgi:hypothetical protein
MIAGACGMRLAQVKKASETLSSDFGMRVDYFSCNNWTLVQATLRNNLFPYFHFPLPALAGRGEAERSPRRGEGKEVV